MHRVPFGTISRGQREGEKNCKPGSRIARFVRSQSRVTGQASQSLSYLIKIQDATLRRNSIPGHRLRTAGTVGLPAPARASDGEEGGHTRALQRRCRHGDRTPRHGTHAQARARRTRKNISVAAQSPTRMLPAARAVARTPSTAARPVAQPPSRHPGRARPRTPAPLGRSRSLLVSTLPRGTTARFVSRDPVSSLARPPRARLDPAKSTSRFSVAAWAGGACRARAVSVAGVAGSRPRGIRLRSPGARPGPSGKAPRPPRPPILLPGSAAGRSRLPRTV